jgi:sigma-54 interacting transcriptional regulator
LFLDKIGDMPTGTEAKLLRALQNKGLDFFIGHPEFSYYQDIEPRIESPGRSRKLLACL